MYVYEVTRNEWYASESGYGFYATFEEAEKKALSLLGVRFAVQATVTRHKVYTEIPEHHPEIPRHWYYPNDAWKYESDRVRDPHA
jgi:hypothetical protein